MRAIRKSGPRKRYSKQLEPKTGTARRAIYDRLIQNRGIPVRLDDLSPRPFEHIRELRERYELPVQLIQNKGQGQGETLYLLPVE